MKSDEATVTLYALHTSERLAEACQDFAERGWPRCPVGNFFACPLLRDGSRRCADITAKDWDAAMVKVQDEN